MSMDDRVRHQRQSFALGGLVLLLMAVVFAGLFWWDNSQDAAHEQSRHQDAVKQSKQIRALAEALTAEQEQAEARGDEPVAPPPDVILANPDKTEIKPAPQIDPERLESAAKIAVEDVLPGELTPAVSAAVERYVAACVASGDCVGPAGPVGPEGHAAAPAAPPGPKEIAAAVLAVCSSDLDCEATPDEIAAAVVSYCGADAQPCGTRWTEDQIYRISLRAVVDYLSGRPIWCPREDEVPNDQPFGPCYVSAG